MRTTGHSSIADAGVRLAGDGTLSVAVPATPTAEAVEVCLLDGRRSGAELDPGDGRRSGAELDPGDGRRSGAELDPGEERRTELVLDEDGWWRGVVPGVAAGTGYGLRVHGPWSPATGVRTNPAKLLVDPWARRVTGRFTDLDAALPYCGDPFSAVPSPVDSAGSVPHALVPAPDLLVGTDRVRVPWRDTVIYETHVRDLTMRHPEVPPEQRGTFAGVAHPAVLEHLLRLGVTTVELLPVFANAPEPSLMTRGRRNHWGYSTLAYLAPEPRYASVPGAEIAEFRTMADALHAAGLELVLDVVFNHSCEGGVDGPSLSWRGLDAPGWYQLGADGRDVDFSGCGNTFDAGSPLVGALVLDCLRYWVTEMGVDGFRFDLASTLGRPGGSGFDRDAPLLVALAEDPVLADVKLIAEPWDCTGEGYQVGGFGPVWAEWNGRYRDGARDFWRGHGAISEIVTRLAGSSDIYWPRRSPAASVNFVTAHDGFTLRDLVSYDRKHNEANGEDDRDGTEDNRSWNCGEEGPTEDPSVLELRARQVRNLLATLGVSAGTPMLLGGDELGHTQHGNNNAYCLDDETSWRSWAPDPLVDFLARVLALRREVPELRRDDFFYGHSDLPAGEVPDIVWLAESGRELGAEDWGLHRETLVVRIRSSSSLLLVLHAGAAPVDVELPAWLGDSAWVPALTSGTPDGAPPTTDPVPAGSTVAVPGRTFLAFRSA